MAGKKAALPLAVSAEPRVLAGSSTFCASRRTASRKPGLEMRAAALGLAALAVLAGAEYDPCPVPDPETASYEDLV